MRESAVESAIVTVATQKLGISTEKLGGQGSRGKADRIFMKAGKTVFIEVKAPGKKPTPLQEKRMAERRADGFPAEAFDNAPLAIQWLRQQFNL